MATRGEFHTRHTGQNHQQTTGRSPNYIPGIARSRASSSRGTTGGAESDVVSRWQDSAVETG